MWDRGGTCDDSYRQRQAAAARRLRVVFLILCAAAAAGCTARRDASQGVTDLRRHDFTLDGAVYLSGKWDVVFGRLLTARDFDTLHDVEQVDITERWRGLRYRGRVLDGKGCATYRLRVLLPPERNSLAVRIPRMSAYALYVGGRRIVEVGRVGTSREHSRPQYQPIIAPLGECGDTLTLLLQVSNYEYWTGAVQAPEFGSERVLRRNESAAFALDIATVTSLFSFAACMFVFLLFRRRDSAMLFLMVLCLSCIARSVVMGEQVITRVLPDVGWPTIIRLELGGMYLMVMCWSLLAYVMFRHAFNWKVIQGIVGIFTAALMLTIATPVPVHSEIVSAMKVVMVLSAVYVIGRTAVSMRRGMEGSLAFLAAFIVNVATTLLELAYHAGAVLFFIPSPVSACLTVFMLLLLLARRYAISYGRMETFADELEQKVEERTLQLRAAQDSLVQQEKLAALGQVTAGIAHEIKNPLNFVNNFAAVSAELLDELPADVSRRADVSPVLADLRENLARIHEHGFRADSIVRNMMLHARGGSVERRAVNIRELLDETTDLAWHGARARMPDFTVTINRTYAPQVPPITLSPQEINRVFMNLISNAMYAVRNRAARGDASYTPVITLSVDVVDGCVEVRVADNGDGVPESVRPKLFTPFFTTKPAGEGTGLGLSISHDIVVKGHGGELCLENGRGGGAVFVVRLPL